MTTAPTDMSPQTTRTLRIVGWSTAALLLLAPGVAMQCEGTGVDWTASDFLFAGAIFGLIGVLLELAARSSRNLAFRIAVAAAVLCGFLQVWINLAVGIIGSEDNAANRTYFAVVLIAASGAIVAFGSARGLFLTMLVAAGAQVIFSGLHAVTGTPTPIIDGFFVALWLLAARLFHRADRQLASA